MYQTVYFAADVEYRFELCKQRIFSEYVFEHICIGTVIKRLLYSRKFIKGAHHGAYRKQERHRDRRGVNAAEQLIEETEKSILGYASEYGFKNRHDDDYGDRKQYPNRCAEHDVGKIGRTAYGQASAIVKSRELIQKPRIHRRAAQRRQDRRRQKKPQNDDERQIDQPPRLGKKPLSVPEKEHKRHKEHEYYINDDIHTIHQSPERRPLLQTAFRKFILFVEDQEECTHEIRARAEQEPHGERGKTAYPTEYAEQRQCDDERHPRRKAVPSAHGYPAAEAEQLQNAQNKESRINDYAVSHAVITEVAADIRNGGSTFEFFNFSDKGHICAEYRAFPFAEQIAERVEPLKIHAFRFDPSHPEHADARAEQKDTKNRKHDAVRAALFLFLAAALYRDRSSLLSRGPGSIHDARDLRRTAALLRIYHGYGRHLRVLPRALVQALYFALQHAHFPFQLRNFAQKLEPLARFGQRRIRRGLERLHCRIGALFGRRRLRRRGNGLRLRGSLRRGRRLCLRARCKLVPVLAQVAAHFAENGVHILFK